MLPFTLFSWHVQQPTVKVEISDNLDSVRLSVVEFGFSGSCSYSTTTNPQFNFLLCQTVFVRGCENWRGCRSLIEAYLPVVSFSWGLVTAGSPQHSLCFPVTLVSNQCHWKKREKVLLLQSRSCSLRQPASQSVSHLFGLPCCLARAHLEHFATRQYCQNTFVFSQSWTGSSTI